MNKKPVDKTKKSNIKCEHCKHFMRSRTPYGPSLCALDGRERNYWNRCMKFEWASRHNQEEKDVH